MPEVMVDGVRLVYDVTGDGPPVLLVCGTGQPALLWDVLIEPDLVAAGYQVLTFDNRGVAPSDVPPPPYSVEQMAADAAAVLEAAGVGPAAVLGASLGGTITQELARTRPDLVEAAVFLVGLNRASAMGVATIKGGIALLGLPGGPPPDALAALMAPALVAPPQWGDDDAVGAGLALASMLVPGDPAGLLGQYQANLAWAERDHLDELAGLTQPVLAIAAEHCNIFPPAQVRAAVARMRDARYVELPGAPHMPTSVEANDLVKASVLGFLAEVHPV